ncbi:MAG: DUF3800 domain-containing protein [Rubrivivax sp.]|nr:DUF3800 domain-containing protein [Rubrivivax sp.]
MTDPAAPSPFSDYIVFVDESGDHSLDSINPDYPVFVLVFCLLPRAAYVDQITPAVRRLKFRHKARYTAPEHPYRLALKYGLERVHAFLTGQGRGERTTAVVCEARGAREDKEIELAFRRVCDGDNRSGKPYPLNIVVADKKTNSERLQLADLLARPVGLHVLRPHQLNRAWDVLATKLYAGQYGVVQGNGLKVFP